MKPLQYILKKARKVNEARKTKTLVFIISTMRSGSTLVKSLLAQAPDTSHLPEVDFQKYAQGNAWKLKTLSPANIIILKKPAAFEQKNYPKIPTFKGSKNIILVRDVYETVVSTKKMIQSTYPSLDATWPYEKLINEYWYTTYHNIINKIQYPNEQTILVRYEDVLKNPIVITQQIFQFIGSIQKEGVENYTPPNTYKWSWGNDDGGQLIQSLKVQNHPRERTNLELLQIIEKSKKVNALRKHFGYLN